MISDFFNSLSSELCGSARVVLCLSLWRIFALRQTTASGGLLSLPNESQSTIKTVLNNCSRTFQVLAKTCQVSAKTCSKLVEHTRQIAVK